MEEIQWPPLKPKALKWNDRSESTRTHSTHTHKIEQWKEKESVSEAVHLCVWMLDRNIAVAARSTRTDETE